MKKILNALFLTLLAVFTFSSCSDVPAPYDILGEGDVPGLTGDGTKENPYDIAAASVKQDASLAWVQGYIVGCVDDLSISTDSKFEAPFSSASNILIADNPAETNYKNCIPVQLVANTDVRSALNLKDNAGNLGKVVMIYGSLEKYFGVAGLKAASAAVLDGVEIGEGGSEQPSGSLAELLDATNPVNQIVNTFDDAENDKDYLKEGYVNFAEVGGRTWRGKPFNGNGIIQATAYTSKEASVIAWLVTPAVDIAKMEVKKVSFDCISAYYVDGTDLQVYFLEKEGTSLKETLLNVGTLPQKTDGYSEAVTLSADLSSIGDKVGFIGFKYIGSSTATGTYQIDNLYVGVEAGGGSGEVDPQPTPEENTIFTETFGALVSANTYVSDFTGWDNSNLKFEVADAKCNIRAKAHMTEANPAETAKVNSIWFPANNNHSFTISGIDASGYSKFIVKYELGANVFNAGSSIDLNVLKVSLNDVEGTAASKIVSKDKNEANVFFDMQVELDVQGTTSSTLKFSAAGADNNMGLLLYNVRLIGVKDEGGAVEPTPGNKYDSNIALPEGTSTDANKASGGKVEIAETEYPILKLGTGSAVGTWNSPVLQAGATNLSFYAVGWTGKTGQLTVSIEGGGTFEGGETSKVIPLNGKTAGATGNPPFKITPEDTDFYTYAMSGITASSTIKFTTEGASGDKRAIVFGINVK